MITLKQGTDFSATIKTKKIYRNFESEFTVTVVNSGASETLPKTLLFTDEYACASFKVYLKGGVVPSGESQVTLVYDGIYKRDTCTDKTISLNGSNGVLKINCSGSGGGENPLEKPIIQNKIISLNNRTNLNFNDVYFTTLYYSPIASPLTEISFWGDVSTITYNGLPYVANTFIPYSDIVSGKVVHNAPDTNNATNYGIYYNVKDADGNLSDFAILNISNNAFGTIVWGNKYISIREEAGYVTRIFTVSYTGASGQSVMFGDLVHSELGANSFDLYINETKTLTGSGSLEFKINGDISSDGSVSILANLFGTLTIRIGVIVIVVEEPEP